LPSNQLRAVWGVMLRPQYRRLNSLATTVGEVRTPLFSSDWRSRAANDWVSVRIVTPRK
jgi:hypothetical protein